MYKEEIVNQKKKKSKEFIALFCSVIVSCTIIYFVVKPMYEDLKSRGLEIKAKESSIKSREAVLLKAMEVEINNEYRTSVEKIKSLVSSRDNYEEYLANIVDIADRKNILIDELQVSDEEDVSEEDDDSDTNFSSRSVSIVASGEFFNFINFLEDIEKNMPLMRIESIAIDKVNRDDSDYVELTSILSFSIQINYFYY
ncbi:MAG: hypothetical protein KAS01_00260 [Candidatus Pacebacteria bacterium]|nr:hypothetical protein [Candidatus Paceibacterota bacterium]